VAGEEGDAPALHLPDRDRRGRAPVRRVDLDGLDVREERVEARPAEDPDVGASQADFPLDSPPPDDDEEEDSADDEDEDDDDDEDAVEDSFEPFDPPDAAAPSEAGFDLLSVR